MEDFYTKKNANPLRGLYELGIEATEAYEAARERVREFINAEKTSEVVFTRNSTESLNLIAYSYGLTSLKAGDEILISIDNHHSNILPWQMVSRQTGAKLVYLECQPDGSYRDEDMEALVTEKTKIAAMPQISNVLGRRNPVEKLTKLVHEKGGVIVIDAGTERPAYSGGCAGTGCRFPCIFRSQADGTDGNRRPVRKRDPSGCDAAVPDGRPR